LSALLEEETMAEKEIQTAVGFIDRRPGAQLNPRLSP
jgi:hypothetical protein